MRSQRQSGNLLLKNAERWWGPIILMRIGKFGNALVIPALALAVYSATSLNGAWAQTNHALIVGVSKYERLNENLWLKGPQNDAVLVRDFLQSNAARKFEKKNIEVLADGVEGSVPATLKAIRRAMGAITKKAQPGDFIYLHFSGHGSQAPELERGSELDGLDELFLPADIGEWDDTIGTVENALVDDEIGSMVDAIRKKGAHVWAVFDSCHSGTVTRAVSFDKNTQMEVSRMLSPSALGISSETLNEAAVRTRGGNKAVDAATSVDGFEKSIDAETGSFVAFYAAQTNQTTPELFMPQEGQSSKMHGLFTYTILEAMAQNPGASYRQLAQEVLRRYARNNRPNPTPLFEGDLDFGVFSTEQTDLVQQWPVSQSGGEVKIDAGRLHGLSKGETLGMVQKSGQKNVDDDVKFEVVGLTDLKATLLPVSDGFVIVEDGQFARKMKTRVNYTFTVALPAAEQLIGKVGNLVESMNAIDQDGLQLEIVKNGERAAVQLTVEDGAIWFVGKDNILTKDGNQKTPSISIDDRSPKDLLADMTDNFIRMAKVNNLTKLGGIFRPSAMGLELEFRVENLNRDIPITFNASAIPNLVPGDVVFMKAENTSRGPLDLNVLYIASDFSIEHIYNARLARGDKFDLDLIDIGDSSFGRERIMVVSVPAAPQSAPQDFSWLAQSKLEIKKGERSGSNLASMLGEAGFSTVTRGGSRRTGNDGGIAQFMVNVVETPK